MTVLEALEKIAPAFAVRGNIDKAKCVVKAAKALVVSKRPRQKAGVGIP
jgi:hypothetical protein